ncbi:MAG: hypothetical protein ACRD6X_08865 [Pyrinomonadaceae bacterium]
MAKVKTKTTREEVLRELEESFRRKHKRAETLLSSIKENREKIDNCLAAIHEWEPDIVYRFYHHSFKVFDGKRLIDQSVAFFEHISPDTLELNPWFVSIVAEARSKEFDMETTNPIWLSETRPILEAIWHCRYFLEQMAVSADTLGSAPEVLPYGWAAVLYLYNLR